jgi:hypothetical protein
MAAATAAVSVGVAGVIAALPLYFGWWELGREPSLNPLETGVAMEAPLLLRRRAPPEESGAADEDFGGGCDGGGHQLKQQQRRRVNSNGGYVHIESWVGTLRVSYCAAPTVEEANKDMDELAEAYAMCVEEGRAGFGHTNGSFEAFSSREKMPFKLVDEELMLRRSVKMVAPRKGERFA